MLHPLDTLDHSLINVKYNAKQKASSDAPFHRTISWYTKEDWDNFRSYIVAAPLSVFFKNRAFRTVLLISKQIISGMANFIPHKKYQEKLNSQPWFIPECGAAKQPSQSQGMGQLNPCYIQDCPKSVKDSSGKFKKQLCTVSARQS